MSKEAQVVLATLSGLMAEKWMNPLRMLKVGSTSGSQSRYWGCTPGCSADIRSQFPCRPGSRTSSWFRDWAWRNKYLALI